MKHLSACEAQSSASFSLPFRGTLVLVLLEHCSKCIDFINVVLWWSVRKPHSVRVPVRHADNSPPTVSSPVFWRQNFAPNVYSWSSRDTFQIRFEWRRWVHFYLNQETEIVITKKSKSSDNIGASRSRKRVNWLKTEKIWFRSKMSLSQHFIIQVQYQQLLNVTRFDLVWPLDHYFR